jgi:hypothetical protein
MSVTGYLSLYTTLIGWQQYQNLWNLMVGTGLVFIPFIGIVMTSFIEPFESQEPKSAAVIALRRLMIKIVGALLIIEFCCVPTVPLNPKVLHFEPACVTNAKIATPGHTGTTYDNQFPVPTGVKVPIIWYLVMAISNGFTHAATEGLSCSKIDYQTLQNQLDLSQIDDPNLKKETLEFYNDCYIPAYSKYMSGNLSDSQQAEIKQYQQQYGKDDLGWIGSQAFLNTPGFYNSLSASEPVKGFLFDPTRDQFEGQVDNHSKWGQPSCQIWWKDPANGLQHRLEKALPPSFLQEIGHLGQPQVADIGIQSLIKHSFDSGMSNLGDIPRGYESLNDDNGSSLLAHAAGEIGIVSHQFVYYPKLYLLINALPVIQALLLLAIYALLALMVPFSSYRLHFIVTGAAIIFAITFWSYLWHLVHYIDNELISALYPTNPNSVIPSWHELLQSGSGTDQIFVQFIVGTLYIVLPMLFLTLASWAGLKISNAIMAAANEMRAPSDAAGQEGGMFARSALQGVISSLIKKVK